jgi:hypothetical protein
MVVAWTRQGQVATVPPLLVQPVAAADAGEVLADRDGRPTRPCHRPRRT